MSADDLISATRASVAALKEQLKMFDAEIAKCESEIAAYEGAREYVATTLDVLDYRPPANEKPAGKKTTPKKMRARTAEQKENRIVVLQDWLESEWSGRTFKKSDLIAAGYTAIPPFGLGPALQELHDRGRLELDHVGTGRAKYYKVVE